MIRRQFLTAVFATVFLTSTTSAFAEPRAMTVYKSEYCGCCGAWIEAVKKAGYQVNTVIVEDMDPIKRKLGVPPDLESCHTVEFMGYVLEGHVPLEAIKKLATSNPSISGIAVPGMPMGALGMGDDPNADYDVMAFTNDGKQFKFAF